jgi:phosphoenolpyruvate carboxykinase (ATP)
MNQTQERLQAALASIGLRSPAKLNHNLSVAALYEETARRGQGVISADGAMVVKTGTFTGRAAEDKFVVRDNETEAKVNWGKVNKPMTSEAYERLYGRVTAYLQNKELFVQDCHAGADSTYRMQVRVITEDAWHSLFARNMFLRPSQDQLATHNPEFTVINVPGFKATPQIDSTRSEAFVVMNFTTRTVLIGGTAYAGEIKKSIFTAMNYYLPQKNVMPMHCSANIGASGDVALFFGLSGTGKTTLSADPARRLIGDDEHGWSDNGIFNMEGGCYAKVIKLSPTAEPEIYATTKRFGTILENVVMDDDTRVIDLDSDKFAENTRASYPIDFIPNIATDGVGGQPKNIVFLTADAFGILPPVSRLTPAQAMYHFLSGYTAKVAGTEIGVKEPKATFSTCFGAPFMPLHPGVYAKLLGEKLTKTGARVWLVNTGWSGGPYGVGQRMKIAYTRAMLTAALTGKLDDTRIDTDPNFGVGIPVAVPGVPAEALNPRNTWADKAAYDAKAKELAGMFRKNFEIYQDGVSAEVRAAEPTAR